MESTPSTPQELAQAEERMPSVVNHVVDGIISTDDRGTVTTFNPAAERIFGYAAAEVIGRNVNLLLPEPCPGKPDGHIANYLHTGQAKIIGIGREVVGQRKDGSAFPMELAVSVFPLGERRHFTGIVRDITKRKRPKKSCARPTSGYGPPSIMSSTAPSPSTNTATCGPSIRQRRSSSTGPTTRPANRVCRPRFPVAWAGPFPRRRGSRHLTGADGCGNSDGRRAEKALGMETIRPPPHLPG